VIQFTIEGTAQPGGSKRGFPITRKNGALGVSIVDANPKVKGWRSLVTDAARGAVGDRPVLRGALMVEMTFFRLRPKGHYTKSGGLSKAGIENPYPTPRPDVLKLARAVEDAMTGVVWADDSQIVTETLRKRWGERALVLVEVEEM